MGKPPAGHDENARVIVGPADRCSERPTQSDAAIHAAVAYRRQEGLGSCIRCNNAATTRHKVIYGRNALDHKRSSCFRHRDVMRDSGQPGPALTLEHFRSVSCDRRHF